ncbi:MAG: glycosyltransferase [Deltaproteobacteria bacterium]|nr:glycosyltransferase [Deltaproteobacteria bacterium]
MKEKDIPVFSIVTPSYNQGRFIEDTIKSVLAQAGEFYIDYVIMDGGSTDASVDIIMKYERLLREGKWPVRCLGIEYRWVSEKDGGQADAIEKGFARARGEIGVWLNSDDVFYSDRVFEAVARYFCGGDADLVIGDGTLIDRDGCQTGVHHTDRIDLRELIFLDYHILQPSAFLKTDYYRTVQFDKRLNYCFDADFFIRLIGGGIRYKKVADRFSSFRLYSETKTLSGREKSVAECMIIARKHTDDRALLAACKAYKYLSLVIKIKYARSTLARYGCFLARAVFYRLIAGAWGRR